MSIEHSYKILLVGGGGVGKSKYVDRLVNHNYNQKYVATLGVETHKLVLATNYGNVRLTIWDTTGQTKYGGLVEGYYVNAHGTIFMYDLSDSNPFATLDNYASKIANVCGQIPSVVIANSKDNLDNSILNNGQYILSNQHSDYQDIIEPVFDLVTKIMDKDDLYFL